ncbi:MAG: hypothetical protein ACR2PI_20130 [Hyphomicrobiaceae bacterium]
MLVGLRTAIADRWTSLARCVIYLPNAERSEVEALYARMAKHFIDGELEVPVEAEYSLDDIGEAVAHAHAEARSGKNLLRM